MTMKNRVEEPFYLMSIYATTYWDLITEKIFSVEDAGPFYDIERAKKAIVDKMGHWPNTLYLPEIAEMALIKAGKIMGYSGFDDTCISQLNQLLGLRIIREVPNRNIKPWNVCVYLDPDPVFHNIEIGEKILPALCMIENTISIKLTTSGPEDLDTMGEIEKGIIYRADGKTIKRLFKCPFCNCYVDKSNCFFDSHGEILFCDFCKEDLSQCPVCRMNMSIEETIPKPCPEPEKTVWWRPRITPKKVITVIG